MVELDKFFEKNIIMKLGRKSRFMMVGSDRVRLFNRWKNNRQSWYGPKHTKKTLKLVRIWQRETGIHYPKSACGPTAAAMVTNYLSKNHLINFSPQDNATLVNMLYKKIGTKPWGTSASRWRKKMERFFNNNSLRNVKWRITTVRAKRCFYEYCRAIDTNMPVLLRFTFNFSEEAFAAHHYVVGIGYHVSNEKKLIAVLDPDGGKKNESIHWVDWDVNEKYMKLIFIEREVKE